MFEIFKLLIGVLVLVLGFFIGNFLAKITKEELEKGRKWLKLIVYVSLLGGVAGLVLGNDFLMFGFFFMAIVASRSLKRK